MNYIKHFLTLAVLIIFSNLFVTNAFATEYTTDGFKIDNELLKCSINSNTNLSIDKNNDFIITIEEWSAQTDVILDCENYNVTDWSALKEIKSMTHLTIKNVDHLDFSILGELTNELYSVELYIKDFNNVTGLDLIKSNTSIKNLKISCDQLADLSFLTKFKKLSTLDICGCNITDVSILNQLKTLRTIDLSNNNISEIDLNQYISCIYLSGNPISTEDVIVAFINLGDDKNVTIEEGTHHKFSFPKCDIINVDDIVLKTNDNKNIRINDHIEFLRNGNATIHVFYENKPIFDYNITITEKTNGSYFCIIKGDVDNNNIVNASDALTLLKISAKLEDMDSTFSIRKNDFDTNYVITPEDALHILKIAAKIEDIQILDDPENFYSEIEYKKGYPTADFISKDLSTDTYYSYDEGMLYITNRGGTFYKVTNGAYEGLNGILYENTNFDKVYWQLRWLIEDAVSNNQLESLDISSYDFRKDIENNKTFNGYWCETKAFALALDGHQLKLGFYISDSNELYIYHNDRRDLFVYDGETVYKYTGNLPDGLTYDSIKELYDYHNQQTNQ